MVSIYKRGSKLYLQFEVNGKRKQKSTGLEDTPQNRKLLRTKVVPALALKIQSGEYERELQEKQKDEETFEKYADKYLLSKEHLKTYWELKSKVDELTARFKGRRIDSISRGEIRDFALEKLRRSKPKTVRGYLGAAKAIFDFAIDYDIITTNPAEKIKLPPNKTEHVEPFTEEEVARLLSNADGWFRNFLALSFYTGLRTGEALGLMWSDIDFDKMEITVSRSLRRGQISTPKTENANRVVPIFDPLVPYLKDQRKRSKSLFVFAGEGGRHYGGADSFRKKWVRLCEKAGVAYRKLYATRHTFITSMLKSGQVSVLELAQMVGHANTEPIMKNYARYIKGEHLKINRNFSPYSTDTTVKLADKNTAKHGF